MPDKSRPGRAKRSTRSKRRKAARGSLPVAAEQPSVSQTYESVPQAKVSVPSAGRPAPPSAVPVVQYPYIVTELRTIGILAGVMLVVLVVLVLVLS